MKNLDKIIKICVLGLISHCNYNYAGIYDNEKNVDQEENSDKEKIALENLKEEISSLKEMLSKIAKKQKEVIASDKILVNKIQENSKYFDSQIKIIETQIKMQQFLISKFVSFLQNNNKSKSNSNNNKSKSNSNNNKSKSNSNSNKSKSNNDKSNNNNVQ